MQTKTVLPWVSFTLLPWTKSDTSCWYNCTSLHPDSCQYSYIS